MKKNLWTLKAGVMAAMVCATALPAYARDGETPAASKTGCVMQQNTVLVINFMMPAKTFAEAKSRFEQEIDQLNGMAAKQGLKLFQLQTMSYNIGTVTTPFVGSPPDVVYQLTGNANYGVDSPESAFKLAEYLNQQKYQVAVNVNKFYNPPCPNTSPAK